MTKAEDRAHSTQVRQTLSPGGPLAGIRIAELTHWQAGPAAGTLLAYLGAEMVKIESRSHLDHYRRTGPDIEHSAQFHEFNSGKLSVRLNLKHPDGAALARRFILEHCDGLLFNIRKGSLEEAGLGAEGLFEERPDLVIVSLSLSGTTGPEADYVGYATNFVAGGGLSHLTGYEDGPPVELVAWPDTAVGAWAAFTMVAGLLRRRRTGRGSFSDLSGRECISALIGDALAGQALFARQPERAGNQVSEAAPNNAYPCAGDDEWVAVSVTSDAEWSGLRRALGEPAWAKGPRFASQAMRWQNQGEIDSRLAEWTSKQSAGKLTELLQEFGVPVAPVMSNKDVSESEHVRQRGAIITVDHPLAGPRAMVGPPWRFDKTPTISSRSAPWLGEHDMYVLSELLGLTEEEVERLTRIEAVH
jgi:benzylsuccinate CoA-transferase BbsF subunit